jgi:hypothetical protein
MRTGPISDSISGSGITPGRSSNGSAPASDSTVDSMPTMAGPPSSTKSTASPNDWRTCSAVVGESPVNGLALGAAMGTPAARMSARASGWDGTRSPTVERPAVTISGIDGRFGRTSVSGPGQ